MQTQITIGIQDLINATGLSKYTISFYLNSYRFSRFRVTQSIGYRSRYLLNSEFLSFLYTYLDLKRKHREGRKLKEFFKAYEVDFIPWEVFICKS